MYGSILVIWFWFFSKVVEGLGTDLQVPSVQFKFYQLIYLYIEFRIWRMLWFLCIECLFFGRHKNGGKYLDEFQQLGSPDRNLFLLDSQLGYSVSTFFLFLYMLRGVLLCPTSYFVCDWYRSEFYVFFFFRRVLKGFPSFLSFSLWRNFVRFCAFLTVDISPLT